MDSIRKLLAKKASSQISRSQIQIDPILAQLEDLKKLTKNSIALPVTGFGIKEVAPIFGFQWRSIDAGGANSEAWYEEWLSNGDKTIWKKILQYNEDDVLAMECIFAGIQNLMST